MNIEMRCSNGQKRFLGGKDALAYSGRMQQRLLSPRVEVKSVTGQLPEDFLLLDDKFASASQIPLWLDFMGGEPPASVSGWVRTAWAGTKLYVLAALTDDSIFTQATRPNQPLYLLGDCFEIFLKFPEGPSYLECHVAPNNLTLELLYPSHAVFAKSRHLSETEFIDRFLIHHDGLISRTLINTVEQRWHVFASVDLRLLFPSLETLAGRELEFNFGRYDHSPNLPEPVLSCTSVLSRLDFHAIEEWGRLVLI